MKITELENLHGKTPSLQKKIESIFKGKNVINAFFRRDFFICDQKPPKSKYYRRYVFGPRGGWLQTEIYKEYDFELMEPFRLLTRDHAGVPYKTT